MKIQFNLAISGMAGGAFLLLWLSGSSSVCAADAEPVATPVSSITAGAGFRVELLRSAGRDEGSWISMTFDDRGRLILGLDAVGVARITLGENEGETRYEVIEDTLRHCRGVLYAHHSLYVSATDSRGFYRLRDTTGDDEFDERKLLKSLDYRSRYGHGSNQVVLGPDGMIYLVNGNDVSFPDGTAKNSAYRDPQNDRLLPNSRDGGQDDRVGHILRIDPGGETWHVVAGGFRNPFDIAFNADGEMFTYDADMEWDVGQPWYRPTRLNHVVSGGEYGWRWGTMKWPTYFADSLPSTLDTAMGSPTGMVFGHRSNFPTRYQNALFMADWQNGRILLADLVEEGASYRGQYDVFLEGGPLNVCDLEFGPDGALYFITGGRGSQSGLYRVIYEATVDPSDPASPASLTASDPAHAKRQRMLRRHLEAFHSRQDPQAIGLAWPHLNSQDRWLRLAARVAIENQDVEQWRKLALNESQPTAAIAALTALCRQGQAADGEAVCAALGRIVSNPLSRTELTDALRVYQLAFLRLGRPSAEAVTGIVQILGPIYPHGDRAVNQLLAELLVYLDAPRAVEKTVALLRGPATQEEQIGYVRTLTHADVGWTDESRQAVLVWLQQARRLRGGRLLSDRIRESKEDFLATLNEEERVRWQAEIARLDEPLVAEESQPIRPTVRQWQMEDLLPQVSQVNRGRSVKNGKQALLAASCLKCHRIGDSGGQIGPDLSLVGKRFDERAILESILQPSKTIDPKYRYTAYILDTGKMVVGRPTSVNRGQIIVETDPLLETTVSIERASIDEAVVAQLSPMPSGLVDILTREEILDLITYLKTGGDNGAQAYLEK